MTVCLYNIETPCVLMITLVYFEITILLYFPEIMITNDKFMLQMMNKNTVTNILSFQITFYTKLIIEKHISKYNGLYM